MIAGTGIDLVKINRIKKMIGKWGNRFLNKIFSVNEINYCQKHKKQYSHFAARFAAKEAVVKMLGTGMQKIRWKDIEIINNSRGKPGVNLSGKAAEIAEKNNITSIHISITHEKEYAAVQVIGETLSQE
ncbi:MAG: holo-ACP synthase [Halanaerobiales bacterium]